MANIESNDLFYSIEKEIEEKIEQTKERLSREKDKLEDTTKKIGTLDKMFIKRDINSYKEKIIELTKLKQSVADLESNNNKKYVLPNEVKSQFENLERLLKEEEVKQLNSKTKECLNDANKEKREEVKQSVAKMQKVLDRYNLSGYRFHIRDLSDVYTNDSISLKDAIKEAEGIVLTDLMSESYFLSSNPAEIQLESEKQMFLSSLEEMIKNNQLVENKSTKNIIHNFNLIKEAFVTKEKATETLSALDIAIIKLNEIKEIDVTKIKTFLNELKNNYKKELEKTNKFLNQFDFSDVKLQIEEERKREEKERLENSKITEYQQLAYQLEKVMTENPNNYEKIHEIKEAMQQIELTSGLENMQLQNANLEGKKKYQTEKQEEKNKADAIEKKNTYEEQLKVNVMSQMRQYAIRELESSGAFKEDYEYRNGDVYSVPMDREAMIQRKIEELKLIADMTPEERGLRDLKISGAISPNATLEDLTLQQISDIRIGYRDSSYEFMADYKAWQAREQIKPQANNVYREYIKYRAELKDKTQFLSFSEYAKQFYNIENMSEIMVDEELKDEIRGMSK